MVVVLLGPGLSVRFCLNVADRLVKNKGAEGHRFRFALEPMLLQIRSHVETEAQRSD